MKSDLILEKQTRDLSLCDRLIEAHKMCEGQPTYHRVKRACPSCGTVVKRSTDTCWSFEHRLHVPGTFLMDLLNLILEGLKVYSEQFEYSNIALWDSSPAGEVFNVQHYEPGQGYPVFHSEFDPMFGSKRHLAWMLYLNDVPDGGTEFLYQDRIVEAKKGKLVIWPAYFTHAHRGIVSDTTEKWIATGWVTYR